MRTGFIGSIVVGIAALAVTPGLLAQSAPRSGTAKADLSGIWNRRAVSDRFGTFADDPGGVPFLGFGKGVPPLRSEGMDKYKANRQGIADARAKGRDDLDPLSSCFPPGPARIFTLPRPFEIRVRSRRASNLRGRANNSRGLSERMDGVFDWQV